MLVLSRKQGEKIVIPQIGMTIHFVKISGNRVAVGIEAPKHVKVLRGELPHDETITPTKTEIRDTQKIECNSNQQAMSPSLPIASSTDRQGAKKQE